MLKTRLITAAVIIAVLVSVVVFLSPSQFSLFFGAVVIVAAWEWANLCGLVSLPIRIAYVCTYLLGLMVLTSVLHFGATPNTSLIQVILMVACLFWLLALLWVSRYPNSASYWGQPLVRMVMGYFVLVPAWVALSYIKCLSQGIELIFILIALVSGADTGAYFSGRKWGNKKLAPAVSPGKSWAGFYGGLLCAVLLAAVLGIFIGLSVTQWLTFIMVAVVTSVTSVLGDLFESMLKRHRGVKDSSQLLPGHGGVLDRIDSMTAAAPVFTLSLILVGQPLVGTVWNP